MKPGVDSQRSRHDNVASADRLAFHRALPLHLIIISIALSAQVFWVYRHRHEMGWDFQLYRASYHAWQAQRDPFDVHSLETEQTGLAFSYFPIFLPLFAPTAVIGHSGYLVVQCLWLVVLALICRRLVRDFWGAMTVLASGFWAIGFNLITGNLGLLEAVFIATAILLLSRRRLAASAVTIGAVASLKLFPCMYLSLYPWQQRRRTVGIALLVFLIPPLLSVLLMPRHMTNWLDYNLGHRHGQTSAIDELIVHPNNPGFFNVLYTLNRKLLGRGWQFSLALLSSYLAALYFLYRLYQDFKRRNSDAVVVFCFGILLVAVAIPRFKPYSFAHLLVPVAVITDALRPSSKIALCALMFLVAPIGFLTSDWILSNLGRGWGLLWYAVNSSQTIAHLATIGILFPMSNDPRNSASAHQLK